MLPNTNIVIDTRRRHMTLSREHLRPVLTNIPVFLLLSNLMKNMTSLTVLVRFIDKFVVAYYSEQPVPAQRDYYAAIRRDVNADERSLGAPERV